MNVQTGTATHTADATTRVASRKVAVSGEYRYALYTPLCV